MEEEKEEELKQFLNRFIRILISFPQQGKYPGNYMSRAMRYMETTTDFL